MRFVFLTALFLVFLSGNAQRITGAGGNRSGTEEKENDTLPKKSLRDRGTHDTFGSIDQYRRINLERDTTYIDTSLTIQREYAFNYLRKDNFGLLGFANDGQTYMTLDQTLRQRRLFPQLGYSAKMFPFYHAEDIKYYSVATPVTELYFRTTIQQGQSVDAFVTVNIRPEFNFSIAYKGLRSLGRYVNSLSSTGNFRFTSSYASKSKRYVANAHFMTFDFLNQENGGLLNMDDFESGNDDYSNRERIAVYLEDAKSFLKGKRLFLDHSFRVNTSDAQNNLSVFHQISYQTRYYEFNQGSAYTELDTDLFTVRFGEAYSYSTINDQARYNSLYNKAGVEFENKTIGHFKVFAEDFRQNYYFGRVLITSQGVNLGSLSGDLQTLGGTYYYKKGKWNGEATFSNSVNGLSQSYLNAKFSYKMSETIGLDLGYLRQSTQPDLVYNLQQSSYVNYNWSNNFRNEKLNAITGEIRTPWVNASAYISTITDKLYFADIADPVTQPYQQLIRPMQYGGSIQYLSVKANKEFRFWIFALDNTVQYQQVQQDQAILNAPKFITRNTLYYSGHFFKKALFLQTGVTFNYFTKYHADDFNPVINEFFVQNTKEIGGFPMLDFFINARIKTCRIYFKAEHFNSSLTGYDYATAPNYPFRDFLIRFGLEWNFFK